VDLVDLRGRGAFQEELGGLVWRGISMRLPMKP
jgi:hypothetical protein